MPSWLQTASRTSRTLFLVGGALLVVAIGEVLVTFGLHDSSDGANIGGGIAMLSVIASFVALAIGTFLRDSTRPALLRRGAAAVGILALLFALQGVVIVAFGIAEEIGR